jgi:transcriptional regulator NrdR family protein
LLLSIAKCCQHLDANNDAYYLSETITAKLLRMHDSLTVSRDAICQTALETLERYDSQAYLAYLAAHGNIKSRLDIKAALKKNQKR